MNELSDEAIALHCEHGARMPTPQSTMHLYPIDGKVARGAQRRDTAFSYRDANWAEVIVGVDPDPANKTRITRLDEALLGRAAPALGRRRVRELHDGRGPGAGAGDLPRQLRAAREDQAQVRPENLFRVNQNVRPGG